MLSRLALLQGLSLAMLGAVFPYLALELKALGVTGVALTLAMTATPAMRLVLGPAWGMASDKTQGSPLILLLAAGAALLGCLALLGLPPSLALLGVLALGIGRTGSGPLVDGLTLRTLEGQQDRYGRVRMWGSLGFLIAAFAAGLARDKGISPLWFGLAAGVGMVAVVLTLPRPPAPTKTSPKLGAALRKLSTDTGFVLLLVASAFHFSGHAVYDSFFSVHLNAQGFDTVWVGVAVTLGVGVEIAVLASGSWLLKRFGARKLLIGAMLLAIPRWVLSASATSLFFTVGAQVIHGVTFGAFWIAAVALVGERAPKHLRTSGLGLLSAAVGGVGSGLGNVGGSLIVDSGVDTHMLFWLSSGLAVVASAAAAGCLVASRRPAPALEVQTH